MKSCIFEKAVILALLPAISIKFLVGFGSFTGISGSFTGISGSFTGISGSFTGIYGGFRRLYCRYATKSLQFPRSTSSMEHSRTSLNFVSLFLYKYIN